MISRLDEKILHDAYRGTGSSPWCPMLMLSIVLYELLNGVSSPAKWHRDATSRDQCKLLGQGISPARSTWYEFRDRAGKFVEQVHQEMIADAIDDGLIDPVECSLDGTFTAASASRFKMFNLKQLSGRLNKLKRAIQMQDDPTQVASRKPLTEVPGWIAPTVAGRQRQLESYRAAKTRLLEKVGKNRVKHAKHKRDESRFVISPADVDAVIGNDKQKTMRPLYNVQNMTDNRSDVIVGYGVFAQANDNGTLLPMIDRTQQATRGALKSVFADCAYCSILDLKDCDLRGIELFAPVQENREQAGRKGANGQRQIPSTKFTFTDSPPQMKCPEGHPMTLLNTANVPRADGRTLERYLFAQSVEHCSGCPMAGSCLNSRSKRRTVTRQVDQPLLDRQIEKMNSPEGKRASKIRSQVVERRFADGKKHRGQREQNGRGLHRVKAEVGLLVIAQNTLTLLNLEKRREKMQL